MVTPVRETIESAAGCPDNDAMDAIVMAFRLPVKPEPGYSGANRSAELYTPQERSGFSKKVTIQGPDSKMGP